MDDDRFSPKCSVNSIIVKNNKILLFRRVNTGWKDGKFGVPGGHLEQDETLLQAMVREIKEESGLIVKEEDLEFVHLSQRKTDSAIDVFFEVKKWNGEPKITEEDKSDEMIWADLNDLPENVLEFEKSAFRHIKNNISFSHFDYE